ncbi:hypothetical protein CWM88_15120 [Klebsiella pneumoniae]|nr:hypothetical protein CWM88_15120 [Klebsiella pneumoniae]
MNNDEAHNTLARDGLYSYWEDVMENQSDQSSGLILLTTAILLWNTVYIKISIDSLKRNDSLLIAYLFPQV